MLYLIKLADILSEYSRNISQVKLVQSPLGLNYFLMLDEIQLKNMNLFPFCSKKAINQKYKYNPTFASLKRNK